MDNPGSNPVTRLLSSETGHLVWVGLFALILLVPLGLIESVVKERHQRYREVVEEISRRWSGPQAVTGPALVVPFVIKSSADPKQGAGAAGAIRQVSSQRQFRAVLLPETLEVKGEIVPETRRRGIYEVRVYRSLLVFRGSFGDARRRLAEFLADRGPAEVQWDRAVLAFGISEPRGVIGVDPVRVGGRGGEVAPGTGAGEDLGTGFHIGLGTEPGEDLAFDVAVRFRGSSDLSIVPVGAETVIELRSAWPSPSFAGEVLPVSSSVGPEGFTARWSVSQLARSYPQIFLTGRGVRLKETTAAVRLFEPVDLYAKVTRSVKYGLLFIGLTFLTVALIELTTGARVAALQYLMVGAALALFFLLLIALSEHLGFGRAYAMAAVMVVALNTLYCRAFLPRKRLALVVGGVLAAIYGVLYVILRAEDYALLSGSAVLVAALAVTMWVTRHLNRRPAGGEGFQE